MKTKKIKKSCLILALLYSLPSGAEVVSHEIIEPSSVGLRPHAELIVEQAIVDNEPWSAKQKSLKDTLLEAVGYVPFYTQSVTEGTAKPGESVTTSEVAKSATITATLQSGKFIEGVYYSKYLVNVMDTGYRHDLKQDLQSYIENKAIQSALLKGDDLDSLIATTEKERMLETDSYLLAQLKLIRFFRTFQKKVKVNQVQGKVNLKQTSKGISKVEPNQPIFKVDFSEIESILIELETHVPAIKGLFKFGTNGGKGQNKFLTLQFDNKILKENQLALEMALFITRQSAFVSLDTEVGSMTYAVTGSRVLFLNNDSDFYFPTEQAYGRELCRVGISKAYPQLDQAWLNKSFKVNLSKYTFLTEQQSAKPLEKKQKKIKDSYGEEKKERYLKILIGEEVYKESAPTRSADKSLWRGQLANEITLPEACTPYTRYQEF